MKKVFTLLYHFYTPDEDGNEHHIITRYIAADNICEAAIAATSKRNDGGDLIGIFDQTMPEELLAAIEKYQKEAEESRS